MKKILVIVFSCLLLVGCSFGENAQYIAKVERYESLINAVLDNDKFASTTDNFHIEASLVESNEGLGYDVIIDKARRALYNIEIVVVENNEPYNENKMNPSFGVFDETRSMIPNQNNPEAGFISGIRLNSLLNTNKVNLKVIVIWHDDGLANTFTEFFEFNLEKNAS